ncbi:MAG: aminotransferase class V-fold PLP-dependent enzyme [Verrucomicrobia bacterium]|nr:aminotransferase class V-fold PLP-dependent enzyme [Verrucomicrobiota bacterium]
MNPLREHWLLEDGLAFLNHGSFGACPRVVMDEQSRLRAEMERNPVRFLWREIGDRLDAARAELARFIGADAEELAFVANATTAVNSVLRLFELQPGDEILVTDHGYNACNNVAAECARRSGAKVITARIPLPIAGPEQAVTAIVAAVTPRTRLVLVDHVTSPTALVLPVAEIVRELEPRGIAVFVDGAHAPGMLPLDLRTLRPSFYTGNLHKWVCAPRGAGFIFVRRDRQAGVHPAVISHGYNTPREGRSLFHDEFDWQGTLDVTAWLTVPAAIRFCESLLPGGWPALMKHNHDLAVAARRLLCERIGVEPPCPETMLGSMATLPLPAALQEKSSCESRAVIARFDPLQSALLEQHRIEVPVVRWGTPARRWFRISAHAYNSSDDYERLADALAAAAKSARC